MRGLLNTDKARFVSANTFEFPNVPCIPDKIDPCKWIDFDVCSSCCSDRNNTAVHCFCDDYKLERMWTDPARYAAMLSQFKYVLMPDFSLYYDFPRALQIYNKYRSHWLAAYFTLSDICVIPNISASTPDNYNWSFLGLPKHSVVAFSDIGCRRNKEDFKLLMQSYDTMIKLLEPVQILYFTRAKECPDGATLIRVPFCKGGEFYG